MLLEKKINYFISFLIIWFKYLVEESEVELEIAFFSKLIIFIIWFVVFSRLSFIKTCLYSFQWLSSVLKFNNLCLTTSLESWALLLSRLVNSFFEGGKIKILITPFVNFFLIFLDPCQSISNKISLPNLFIFFVFSNDVP